MAELILPGVEADDATAKANVIGSVGTPEEAAQAIKVGKKLNLPGDTVVGSPKIFQQDADLKDQMEALNANPKLAGFVAASPVRAQAAKDDFANLNTVGSRAEDYSKPGLMSDLAEVMTSTFGKKPIGWSEEQRELNPGLVQTFESSILMKAAIPLGDVAFRAFGAALAGSSVALAETWEALGYPDIPTALPGINVPIDPALKGPAGKRRLTRDIHTLIIGALTELGMRPTVPVEMARAAKEAVQKTPEIIPAEPAAKAKPSEFAEARKTAETVEEAPIITPLGKAAAERGEHLAPGLDPFHDQVHVAQQKIDILKLDAEMKDAQNSQLKLRAPDEFAAYLRDYHGDQEISISAETLRDLYAKEGKEIAENDGLFGFVGDLREQIARGLGDGTEVKIPVADFIAHGDPTVYEKIKDNVRLRDGVTKEEAKELAKKKPEDYVEYTLEEKPQPQEEIETGFEPSAVTRYAIKKGGREIAEALFSFKEDKTKAELLNIEMKKFNTFNIESVRNEIGPRGIRELLRQFKKQHPEITTITGNRVSGARFGGDFESAGGVPVSIKFPDLVKEAVVEAIEAEQKAMWLDRAFDSPETLGLTQDSFNRYSKKLEERAQAIDDKAMKAAEREVARRQKPEWKKNEAETREQVSNDISYSPTFMADRFLRTGEYPSPNKPESFKLDRADVESRYGKGYLPENMLAAEGLSLDDAAPFFGFDSGEAMARRLSLLENQRKELGESPRQYYARIIKEKTAERMEERYGSLESVIRSEAEDMVARSTQEEILHIEMEGIAAQAGGKLAITLEQVRASAEAAFRQTPIKHALKIEQYVKAAGRAGQLTEQALLKGKFDDAIRYKQQQIMATMMLNEAKAQAKKAKRANTLYDNYVQHENLPAVDQFHTDYIHSLLNAVGHEVRRDPVNIQNAMDKLPALSDFATGRNAQGGGILVMEVPRKNTLNEFTVDEYNDFFAMIKSLDHNGRKEKTIEVRGKLEDYEKGIDLIAKNLDTLKKKNFDPQALGAVAAVRRGIRELDSRLIKFEQLFEWIDKNDPFGPITQMVYRPIIEAEHGKLDMIAAIAEDAGKIPVSRKWGRALTDSVDNQILLDENQNPVRLTNENKIAIALNWGNQSNRIKLMKGHNWTEADVNAFLDRHMTKMDHDFVQGIWRLFDRLGPLVEKVTTERSGVPVSLVEPVSVGAKGELPGGYYPLLRDSIDALYQTRKKVDLYDNPVFDPLPIAAALMKRTGDVYPLDLTLGKLHNRIAETVHAVFMQTPMRQAYKVWGDPLVRQGVGEAFGPEYVRQGDLWLEDVATNGGSAVMNVTSRMLRENVVSLLMGWKISTALIHGGAAFSTSIYEAVKPGGFGGANYAKAVHELGIAQFMPDVTRRFFSSESKMWETVKFVEESSPEMRNRGRSVARDVGYQLNSVVNKNYKDDFMRVRAAHLAWSMSMVAWTDKLSAMQVWLAAYKKGELEGLLHDDSVFFADKAVRQAHGSASLVNRANIGRGEVNRWLTIAYNGYWNHNYNRTRSATRDVLRGPQEPLQLEGPTAEMGGFKSTEAIDRDSDWNMRMVAGAAAFTAIIIVPAIVHDVVRPGGHKDESWIRWFGRSILSQFGGQIPMVNTATYSIMHGQRDPHVSPFDKIFKTTLDVWHDSALLIEGKKADKFLKHAAMMSQTLTGVGGTDASATAAQFIFDVNRNKERPRSVMEWSRGLITGSAKQQKGKGY